MLCSGISLNCHLGSSAFTILYTTHRGVTQIVTPHFCTLHTSETGLDVRFLETFGASVPFSGRAAPDQTSHSGRYPLHLQDFGWVKPIVLSQIGGSNSGSATQLAFHWLPGLHPYLRSILDCYLAESAGSLSSFHPNIQVTSPSSLVHFQFISRIYISSD